MSLNDINDRIAAMMNAQARMSVVDNGTATIGAMQAVDAQSLNVGWSVVAFFLVMSMQFGMSLFEAGSNRRGTLGGNLVKNTAALAVTGVVWWLWGWALSFGVDRDTSINGFVGNADLVLVSENAFAIEKYVKWAFQLAMCNISLTIVLGATAERLSMFGSFVLSLFYSGFIYPVVAHWTWSDSGFFSPYNTISVPRVGDTGLVDLAGAATVHFCGGVAALAAVFALGARKERFDAQDATPYTEGASQFSKFMGLCFIFFGYFGFITGSMGSVSGRSLVCGQIALNLILALGAGGVVTFVVSRGNHTKTASGAFAGLVAIASTASCVEAWAAVTIGAFGAIFYLVGVAVCNGGRFDDATNGFGMHGLAGLLGTLAPGIFATQNGIAQTYNHPVKFYGFLYNGGAHQFGVQLLAVVIIFAWSFFWTAVVAFVLKAIGKGRVSEATEELAADESASSEAYVASYLGLGEPEKKEESAEESA